MNKSSRDPELFLNEFGNIENLKCSICLQIPHPDDAIEHKSCAHVFCSLCISNLLNSQCPICQEPQTVGSNRKIQQENLFVYRLMKSFKTKCDFKECVKVMEWRDLDKHLLDECEYFQIECIWKCGVKMIRKEIFRHQEECDLRMRKCQFCLDTILFKDRKLHEENECEQCPFRVHQCKYAIHGCKAKFEKKNEELHMKEAYCQHLDMISIYFFTRIKSLEIENQVLKEKMKIIENNQKPK